MKAVLQQAVEDQGLSAATGKLLSAPDVGEQIQDAIGIEADSVESSEVTLVTFLVDDSGSISAAGNEQAVRDGHNLVIDALVGTKQKKGILMHTRYLNGTVLFPYQKIEDAVRMDKLNYAAMGGTPLYDQAVVALGSVIAEAQQLTQNGIQVRSVTVIVTDGHDEHSKRNTAPDVKKVVRDMGEDHIVAAIGIDDGSTDFRRVFGGMGIQDKWIIVVDPNDQKTQQSEIRRAFQMVSQSAVRASQGAANFSKTAMGGFGVAAKP
jgi:hypothetical protein